MMRRPLVNGLVVNLSLVLAIAACGAPEVDATSTDAPGNEASGQAAPATPEKGPRTQPGTEMGLYTPEQHDLYDGRFNVRGTRIFQAGTLTDDSPWDHMGDDASNLREVGGAVEFEVNEIDNTGSVVADLELPEGRYRIELDRFVEFSPCQDGGIAAFLFEHGDAGCGDANWPKSLLYVAGWGLGRAWLDDELLYEDYQIHFMVTQGMRDRETLVAATSAGATLATVSAIGCAD